MNKLPFLLINLALAATAFWAVEYKEYSVQYCFYLNDKPCLANK